jgi:hypothetical protein
MVAAAGLAPVSNWLQADWFAWRFEPELIRFVLSILGDTRAGLRVRTTHLGQT